MGKRRKQFLKKEQAYTLLCGTIIGTPEVIAYQNGNIKSVFEIINRDSNRQMCVYWSNILLEVGEIVTVKGNMKNNVFLVRLMVRNYVLGA